MIGVALTRDPWFVDRREAGTSGPLVIVCVVVVEAQGFPVMCGGRS